MSYIVCPHCLDNIPYGASVCRGCQAEVKYGQIPGFLIFLVFLASLFVGGKVTEIASGIVGLIFGLSILCGGLGLLMKKYAGQVTIKRYYLN
jgi:hypothetical protein